MSKILIMLIYFLILLFSCLLYKKVTREGYRENNVNKDKLTNDFWKYLNNSVNSTVEDKIDNSIDDKIDDKINNITDGIEDIVETKIDEKYNDFLLSDEFKNQVDSILSNQFNNNEGDA